MVSHRPQPAYGLRRNDPTESSHPFRNFTKSVETRPKPIEIGPLEGCFWGRFRPSDCNINGITDGIGPSVGFYEGFEGGRHRKQGKHGVGTFKNLTLVPRCVPLKLFLPKHPLDCFAVSWPNVDVRQFPN